MDTTGLKGVRVLIVDENAINVHILKRQLQVWGIQVASAASAVQALQWLREAADLPHVVVIADVHMPQMDGVAFARAVRAEAAWQSIALVALSSGFLPAGDENTGFYQARLLKPARRNQLLETVLRCIAADKDRATSDTTLSYGTVLVADDNAVNLKVASAMLLKLGYEPRTAANGREALEAVDHAALRGPHFAAILMDVNMPELNGLEATRQIRAMLRDRAPPIIAVTAAASPDCRARCEAAGMDDHLAKPLRVAALAQMLEKWARPAPTAPLQATESAAATSTLLVDFAKLEEFREYDDAELSMTREMIGLFLSDTPKKLLAIEAAIAACDAEALAKLAHALKGSAGNVGAAALCAAAGTLEAAATHGWPSNACARAAQLKSVWTQTRLVLSCNRFFPPRREAGGW